MAIFKKLNIGATVATSGTRAFKKLTTELPIWNGTDLTGTTWEIPFGWTAEAGYGEFDVYGKIKIPIGSTISYNYYTQLLIGYYSYPLGSVVVRENEYTYLEKETGIYVTPTGVRWFYFEGGTDATNPRLINWLLENGRLTSHTMPEPELPIWNGTDLKGTTWVLNDTLDLAGLHSIATDDIKEAAYCDGEKHYYDIEFLRENRNYTGIGVWTCDEEDGKYILSFLYDGYTGVWVYDKDGWIIRLGFQEVTEEQKTIKITGGAYTTNANLINWLLQNAELTSHRLVINGTYRLNDTITELPIVYADGENIEQQSAFNVVFYVGSSPSAGLFCMQEADGITLHPMPTLSVYYLYDFRTNTWRKDELRNFTFDNATATNNIGEDVTQVLLWWIVTNATKQDSQ